MFSREVDYIYTLQEREAETKKKLSLRSISRLQSRILGTQWKVWEVGEIWVKDKRL